LVLRKITSLAAIALSVAPGIAMAAEPACLTSAEFTALSSYALPNISTGAAQRCAATLPADAFLKRSGDSLARRYADGKPAAWPAAKAAFLKMGGAGNPDALNLIKSLPDATLQQLVDTTIQGIIAQRLPTEQCGMVDRVTRLLSPLPPENTAELIALAAGLGSRSGTAKVGSLRICAAQ